MNQDKRRLDLIKRLLNEKPWHPVIGIPQKRVDQERLLRSLMNIRTPLPADDEFYEIQDKYLQTEIARIGITKFTDLLPVEQDLCLWQGDITTIRCDAIVNAANSGMTGCYVPCHICIDNCIHTFAGVQLRLACNEMMQKQGYEEPQGQAKITSAYNLPCDFVLHTVGPIIRGNVTKQDEELLASCYRSCLALAVENKIKSIAFCCISTGEYHFPNQRTGEIAVAAVRTYKKQTGSDIKVVFNVFKDIDYEIYRDLLGSDSKNKT